MLANVLGVQRTTVSAAAMELQQERLISYRRGRIEILDRAGLELAACECYGTIRANFDRLLPHVNNVASAVVLPGPRPDERRVGKECFSTCQSRWSQYH